MESPTGPWFDTLRSWADELPRELRVGIVLVLRPACGTRSEDLKRAADMCREFDGRILLRVALAPDVRIRRTSYLCFCGDNVGPTIVALGSNTNLWPPSASGDGDLLVFRAHADLRNELLRSFEWDWERASDVRKDAVVDIPALALPPGSAEGARMWSEYSCRASALDTVPSSSSTEGAADTSATLNELSQAQSPSEITRALGLPAPDGLADFVSTVYARGSLVTIEKLSRIPPLDAPLDPRLFGDMAEIRTRSVSRRVSMRVSIISESDLKSIERLRTGVRTLLPKLSYSLADGVRWMPTKARPLFDHALAELDLQGKAKIAGMIGGDIERFIESKRTQLHDDIRAMCDELGRPVSAIPGLVPKIESELRTRLARSSSESFLPLITHMPVVFEIAENERSSPWAQAAALLRDVAMYARRALTEDRFFLGLKADQDVVLDAMDVAKDSILLLPRNRATRERASLDLIFLEQLYRPEILPRKRCELTVRLLAGEPAASLDRELPHA